MDERTREVLRELAERDRRQQQRERLRRWRRRHGTARLSFERRQATEDRTPPEPAA